MIDWRRVPWPLWVLYPVLMFTWLCFLLKGVRGLWVVTVGIDVLGLIPYLISGSLDWQGVAFGLVSIPLLLLPVTRRYFSDGSVDAGLLGP